MNQQLIALK